MNTKFVSKYQKYSIVLDAGKRMKDETGYVTRTPEKRADFENGVFDAENANIPGMSTKEVVKALRREPAFGNEFYQPEKPPVRPKDIVDMSIRDLKDTDIFDEINDPAILIKARKMEKENEDRKMAIKIIEKELENKFDVTFKKGNEKDEE